MYDTSASFFLPSFFPFGYQFPLFSCFILSISPSVTCSLCFIPSPHPLGIYPYKTTILMATGSYCFTCSSSSVSALYPCYFHIFTILSPVSVFFCHNFLPELLMNFFFHTCFIPYPPHPSFDHLIFAMEYRSGRSPLCFPLLSNIPLSTLTVLIEEKHLG
jgi:hypothetical protein